MEHLIAIATYVQTHALGVLLAVLASMLVGFLWHGPLFGKQWMKYNKIKAPKKGEATFSKMLPGFGAAIVMAFVQAAVMGRTFEIVMMPNVGNALLIATILWLPFTALVIVNGHTWEGKSVGHMCLDAFYNLASMWAIATVLYATL